MKNQASRYIILLLLSCLGLSLNGQEIAHFPNVQYLTTEDGLSQNEVTCILQDKTGFLWIGTRGGLNRYDGTDFKIFQNEIGNPNSLINNSIESLFEDSEGLIWIGTKSNGLSCYDPIYDRFTHFQHSSTDSSSISGNRIISIAEGADGSIWLGTNDKGLNILDKKTGKITRLLGQMAINNILRGAENEMYLASNNGLFIFSPQGEQLGHYPGEEQVIQFTDLVQDPESGNLFLGTWNQGLYCFDLQTRTFRHIPVADQAPTGSRLKSAYHLSIDREGRIWVGSWGQSLHVFDPVTESITSYELTTEELDSGRELYKDILFIYQDRNHILWIGTNGGGLCKVNESINQFAGISYRGEETALPKEPIWAVMKDDKGTLYVSIKGNNNLFYSEDEQTFFRYELPVFDEQHTNMKAGGRTLLKDREGNLWVGTNFSLLKILPEGVSKEPSMVRILEEGTKSTVRIPKSSVLYQTSDGIYWIGTQQNGLRRSLKPGSPEGNIFRVYRKEGKEGLSSNRISAILEDKTGRVWVGTYQGLHLYRPLQDDFIQLSKRQGDLQSLSSDIIICIFEDSRGNLWVGTPNGLNLVIPGINQSWKVECFQEKDGLPNNYIHSIMEDGQGNLWIATNKGLAKFDPVERIFSNYDVSDGLHSNSFMEGVAFKGQEGKFYFGGVNGLNVFHPDSIRNNALSAPMVLTGFKVLNQELKAGQLLNDRPVLEQSILYSSKISLGHRENIFSIDYASLDFSSLARQSYQYKMEGLDDTWRFAGSQKTVTYTNLSPGNYTFKVKVASNRAVQENAVAQLHIEIRPPFWNTWPAYLIYTLVFIGLLLLYRHFISLQSDLRNKLKLSRIEKEKEVEMAEMKTRFFTNITHELRTPLTLISGPVAELLEGDTVQGKAKQYLLTINHHAQRLLGLVNQLLDFRKAETGNMKLRVAEGDIVKFTGEVFLSFRDLANRNKLQFVFDSAAEEIPLYFDRDKMEIVLCNLLTNALKYTPEQRKVTLSIQRVNKLKGRLAEKFPLGYCKIRVKDTGKGMPEELLEKIFDRYYQLANTDSIKMVGTGIGLSLVKTIVDLHGGDVQVRSKINKGSCFTIRLPFGKRQFSEDQIISDFKNSEHYSHYQNELLETVGPAKASPLVNAVESDSGTLLVVEDNPGIRSFIRSIFERTFTIYEAANGEEGLALAKDQIPDVVISDVIMPKMDGLCFCKAIKEEESTAHIPVILLTARTSTVFQIEGYHSGADAYVTKPFSPAVLKAQVNSMLEARQRLKSFFGKKITLQPTDVEISSLDEQFLEKAMQLVEEHIDSENLSRDFLAQALAMSPSTLYRKLKALTGLTTNAFIRSIRLKRAAQLLQQSQYNISEIAYQVGFNDLKYFRNCFKDQFGCTPSQFMEGVRQLND